MELTVDLYTFIMFATLGFLSGASFSILLFTHEMEKELRRIEKETENGNSR